MNLIEFKDVSFWYSPDNTILRNFNLEIKKNCWTVVTGETGCGKTTIIKLIFGLIKPITGEIVRNFGKYDLPGWLMQNPDEQLTQVTVERELSFPLENRGLPLTEIRQKVETYLELFDLKQKKNYPVYLLSGGEKQRLALASLLIYNQQVLILDEPVSLLDVEAKLKFIKLLRSFKNLTVVWFTSEREECKLADELIIL